jgi:gliding motility-associated-like protein
VQAVPQISVIADPVQGCMPLQVTFNNNTQFSTSSEWNLGNGQLSNATSPSTNYLIQGTYTASLTAHNYNFGANLDCPAQQDVVLSVFPKPTSSFALDANSACGPPAVVGVNNQSTAGMAYIWSWAGQSSMQFEPVMTFADTGLKVIELVVSNEYSCSDTTQNLFDVIGQPTSAMRITPPIGCSPLDVEFESFTPYGDSWEWDFGDGNTANGGPINNHQYTEAGVYQVSMRITNENQCSIDTVVTSAVVVHPRAQAGFSISPDEISVSYPVAQFENESVGATEFIIEPGDGSNYPTFISQHLYNITAQSSFTVTLIANNQFNCPDTLSKELNVAPAPSIFLPNSFTPNGDRNNDEFGPEIFDKPYLYDFLIFDRWGHLVFETFDKEVKWNGTYFNNGKKPIKQDVYVYKIVIAFEPNKLQQINGNITVIY